MGDEAHLAFSILFLTAFVSFKYYESTAFERPFHFSILTLLFTGTFMYGSSRSKLVLAHQTIRYQPLPSPTSHGSDQTSKGVTRIAATLRSLFASLFSTFSPLPLLMVFGKCKSFLPFVLSIFVRPQPRSGREMGATHPST
ncbi:hypothetical protein F4776DRAFT_423898 [Hypoxylon sp. NC0597]|nr:hypothetical protein F4776DRAFT_423898 [Hypoxylon sp. NC0597]